MSEQDYDDFDDLDDLLDEDPTKLEVNDEEFDAYLAGSSNAQKPSNTGNNLKDSLESKDDDSQGMQTMMEQLRSEFNNLMVNDPDNVNNEVVDSFKELMTMLNNTTGNGEAFENNAGSESTTNGRSTLKSNNGDFKNVVQSTLHKIRENGNIVDGEIKEEKKKAAENSSNSDFLQETLLNKVFSELGASGMDENIDDTVLKLLHEMSNKDIIYRPMKDLYADYDEFFMEYGKFSTNSEEKDPKLLSDTEMKRYKDQYEVIGNLIALLEQDDFSDTTHKDMVSNFLDELERLGESPMSSAFMKDLRGDTTENSTAPKIPDLDKLDLENIDLKDIEKEMQESCPQQ